MNIGEYSVTNKVTTWLLVILFVAGGLSALQDISRLEDPEFTSRMQKSTRPTLALPRKKSNARLPIISKMRSRSWPS